jgi:hypothetical protein
MRCSRTAKEIGLLFHRNEKLMPVQDRRSQTGATKALKSHEMQKSHDIAVVTLA